MEDRSSANEVRDDSSIQRYHSLHPLSPRHWSYLRQLSSESLDESCAVTKHIFNLLLPSTTTVLVCFSPPRSFSVYTNSLSVPTRIPYPFLLCPNRCSLGARVHTRRISSHNSFPPSMDLSSSTEETLSCEQAQLSENNQTSQDLYGLFSGQLIFSSTHHPVVDRIRQHL